MIKLPQFKNIKQPSHDAQCVRRVHLWRDGTWDESGGHTVAMSMDTYEEIRKELNILRRIIGRT